MTRTAVQLDAVRRPAPPRLVALDAVRGITIAGMILVNNPGSWQHIYPPLRHAAWHGWTPTDLVFPFFLFIVGVSMALSFGRRAEQGVRKFVLFGQVVRRSMILFLLGLTLYGFPDLRLVSPFVLGIAGLSLVGVRQSTVGVDRDGRRRWFVLVGGFMLIAATIGFLADVQYFHTTHLRVPGVLQRIAACYFIASLIALGTGTRGQVIWTVMILLGYWWIVTSVSASAGYVNEVTGTEGLLHDWIDVQVFGEHLYRNRPDPEGLLSTIPAVATVLIGLLTGTWLRSDRDERDRVIGLFVAAGALTLLGWSWSGAFPINKKIWTSSYVCLTAGLAMHLLATCYWLIDVRQYRRWATPFVIFGTNAIVVFFASSLAAKMLGRWKLPAADGTTRSVKSLIYEHGFASWAGPLNGSLAHALVFVAVSLLFLLPLYRKRIFIRI